MAPNKIQLIQLKSIEYRGLILHEASILEKMIDGFICRYFFDTKTSAQLNNAFIVTILDRTSFDSKISIFEALLKIKYGKDDFKKKHYKLFSEIRKAKDHRNIFAHYIIDIYSPDEVAKYPNSITLVGFRNAVTQEVYTDSIIDQILSSMRKCVNEIHDRIQLLGDEATDPTN